MVVVNLPFVKAAIPVPLEANQISELHQRLFPIRDPRHVPDAFA